MRNLRAQLRLYLVTDPQLCADRGVVETVRQAVAAGVTMVQLRDKHATTAERTATARALKAVLHGTGVPLVINDDIEAAIAADVDGAHIGQEDLSPAEARELLGAGKILGLSCETPATVQAADPSIVDYLGVGPVFGTPTKTDHKAPIGMDGLAQLVALSPMPTVAIGGLKAAHHPAVLKIGADGSAVVSAICGQPDIAAATRAFTQKETSAMTPNVLSIAGSDPSGGAGIQADLKSISANGAFAMAAVTALTAQNTTGVTGIHLVPADFVASQIKTVADDIRIDAVKIGMIATAEIAEAVADALSGITAPIVLDPVMIAKGGAPLLQPDAVAVVRDRLVPLAHLVTPNLPEAAHLLNTQVATTRDEMEAQGHALRALGSDAVLIKGGHLDGEDSPDCLVTATGTSWFESPRIATKNTHGTGCTLSSALAAQLAKGLTPVDAVSAAKTYVSGAIAGADDLTVGSGHGPTHHFSQFYALQGLSK